MPTQEMDELKQIFASNLKKYLEESEKTQTDLQKYMNVSSSTASDWIHGIKMPRMDKIQSICNWLHIEKSDLLEKKDDSKGYYINQETAQVAQKIMENKELGLLFSAASDASPEDLLTVHQMLLALKRKEQSD